MSFKAPLFTKLKIAQQRFEEQEHTPVDPETWQARTQCPVKYACHRTGLEGTPINTLCKEILFKVMKMRHTTVTGRRKDCTLNTKRSVRTERPNLYSFITIHYDGQNNF